MLLCAAPNKEQAWQADASAWKSHSRELADSLLVS